MGFIKAKKTQTLGASPLRLFLAWGLPAIIMASYLLLALQSDLALAFRTLAGGTAVVVGMLTIILYAGEREAFSWSPGVIIILAAIFRIFFLFHPPNLSDDLYRYLWDGLQTLSGHNPYAGAPSTIPPHDETSRRLLALVNHPELVTIYPPGAQLVFAAGAWLRDNFLGIKLMLTAMDLVTCALIMKLLSSMGLPAWRAVLYAWHPLPILEIGSSGHIDGAGVFFFLLALVLLITPAGIHSAKPGMNSRVHFFLKKGTLAFTAGLAFAWAALVKLLPLLLLPGLFLLLKRRCKIQFLAGIMTGAAALTLPFLPDIKNIYATLNTYIHHWEFAGFAFRTLRRLTSSGDSARLILAALSLALATALYGNLMREARNGKLEASDYSRAVMSTLYAVVMAYLLLTPTLHPWYALYFACLLPFAAGVAGLILTWAVFLSYRILIVYELLGKWIEDDCTPASIWLAPAFAFLLIALINALNKRKRVPRLR